MGSLHQLATVGGDGLDQHLHRTNFFSCTVGQKPSKAKFFLHDVEEVSEMFEALKTSVVTALKADDQKLEQLTLPTKLHPNSRTGLSHLMFGGSPAGESDSD